jgi:hypothetical protein
VSIITLPTKCTRSGAIPHAPQVVERPALGGEQQVGELIGEHPVDLLGHAPVETSQARLDVDHRHPLLGRH